MRVLIGCEFSGRVRDAFIAAGHDAVSCDLVASERPGPHIRGDLFKVAREPGWDLLIFHWDCVNMAVSGARHFYRKGPQQAYDVACFVSLMEECPIPRIAGENPISVLSTQYRQPDQIIWPYWFGHKETKRTCLWLKNLPPLVETDNVGPPPPKGTLERKSWDRVHREPPGPNRKKNRSRTLPGIAAAYTQWGEA